MELPNSNGMNYSSNKGALVPLVNGTMPVGQNLEKALAGIQTITLNIRKTICVLSVAFCATGVTSLLTGIKLPPPYVLLQTIWSNTHDRSPRAKYDREERVGDYYSCAG
jgi:hypothetical protein